MLELIKCPILTKKTTRILEQYGQYVFDVCPKLTKFQIRFLIETIFSVQVVSVNTHIRHRAKSGRFKVFPATYKRAIVKVRRDEKIILFPDSLSLTFLCSIGHIHDF